PKPCKALSLRSMHDHCDKRAPDRRTGKNCATFYLILTCVSFTTKRRNVVWPLVLMSCFPALVAGAGTLDERLAALSKAHQGTVAIAVKHLDNSETVFINADEVLPTASLIKFPVMLEVYMQVLEGKVKLSDMVTLKE